MKKRQKKQAKINLNLGSGVGLIGDGFINVDNFFSLSDLKEGVRTKDGVYKNAVIPPGARFVKANILKLPFKKDYADYAEMLDVIEHFAILDVIPALTEIRRVMKPGGTLALITNDFSYLAREWLKFEALPVLDLNYYAHIASVTYGNQFGEGEYHKVPFSPRVLKFMFSKAGWDVENKVKIVLHKKGEVYPDLEGRKYPQRVYFDTDAIRVDAVK